MCSAELGPKLGHRKFSIKISFSLNEAIGFNGEEKRKEKKKKGKKEKVRIQQEIYYTSFSLGFVL